MPIIEIEPWCEQYFASIACPPDVFIPTDDTDCYRLYPSSSFIYNKLFIAESQQLVAAPHGIMPPVFPVFSKPIYNLQGMGRGSTVLESYDDYLKKLAPGHMWMELLSGDHISSDVAVLHGAPVWWRHTKGAPMAGGTFDYWEIMARGLPAVEDYCAGWIARHMSRYCGMMNIETIGGRIIEAHLRFANQWPDLYGVGWVEAAVKLYSEGVWAFADENRQPGYSVILFGAHGVHYRHPPAALQAEIRAMPEISSLQITFSEQKPPHLHAMPPGGFRLAAINCTDLDQGRKVRDELKIWFNRFSICA